MTRRSIGVVTVARSDYGIYKPVLDAIAADERLELRIYATGMHLAPEFGTTVDAIAADGFAVNERVESLVASDSAAGSAKSMGLGTIGFADVFARARPDLAVVLGDRFEMHAAAVAALPFAIPVAHLHGGEATFGAFDESLRHSMTKLSHLHFPATAAYAERIVRMGEEPWRVHIAGAPGLDNIRTVQPLDDASMEAAFGIPRGIAPILVTYHPATLDFERGEEHAAAVLEALAVRDEPIVFTMPNADPAGRSLAAKIERFSSDRPSTYYVRNFGMRGYLSIMRRARAMVGNSSSGIIEAASFELPVVNIGERQAGRIAGENVVHAENDRASIAAAIERALDPAFRAHLRGMVNPYGDGHAAARIVSVLRDVELDRRLLMKRFFDIAGKSER